MKRVAMPMAVMIVCLLGMFSRANANPVIPKSDTPKLRLSQDNSAGYSAQVWDIAGNEANFFIRDISGGSKLPFRIQPGAPTSTLTLRSDGNVGIGTWAPTSALAIYRTGADAAVTLQRTDGVVATLNASGSSFFVGATSNHSVGFLANNVNLLSLNPDGSLTSSSGASLTSGGVWTNASSRSLKEDIKPLSTEEALQTLNGLEPVLFRYKAEKNRQYAGFIAEDVPEMLASSDRRGLSPMDIAAVLVTVVQEQQQTINALRSDLEQLKKMIKEHAI